METDHFVFTTDNSGRLTHLDIQESKQFWATRYSSGGQIARSRTMAQFKIEQFWSEGENEMIGCLDATHKIPSGGSGYLNHCVSRES
jgi:hypothetical protein